MSQDVKPFVPPARYPSPPKDMWYEVPKQRPAPSTQAPKSIFPWEAKQPQPSRAFPAVPDDPPPAEVKDAEAATALPAALSEVDSVPTKSLAADSGPAPSIWSSFTLVNAWDDVPEISRYVERARGHRRGKSSQISLPTAKSGDVPETSAKRKPNFQSLKLTDFPTEMERPSLPVTPAPVRRPSFWGDDGDDAGNDGATAVPTADGVPAQSEWVCPDTQFSIKKTSSFLTVSFNRTLPSSYRSSQRSTPRNCSGGSPVPTASPSACSTSHQRSPPTSMPLTPTAPACSARRPSKPTQTRML